MQKGYTKDTIVQLLQKAGMSVLEVKDADTGDDVTEVSQRIYVVAKEQGKSL